MGEESSSGQIKVLMKEISFKITSMEKENINGPMVEFTTASGLITKWKVKAPSPGAMAVDTLAAIKMIKSMVMVLLSGQMVASILVNGVKANNTEKEFTSKKVKRGKESGKWARELSGSRLQHLQQTARSSETSLIF